MLGSMNPSRGVIPRLTGGGIERDEQADEAQRGESHHSTDQTIHRRLLLVHRRYIGPPGWTAGTRPLVALIVVMAVPFCPWQLGP
jgi:hypothetical protein